MIVRAQFGPIPIGRVEISIDEPQYRWMREHGAQAPSAYPDVHYLTSQIRAAARDQGDPDGFHLWAGQAHTLARPVPAGELVRQLAAEAQAALREAAGLQEPGGGDRSPLA